MVQATRVHRNKEARTIQAKDQNDQMTSSFYEATSYTEFPERSSLAHFRFVAPIPVTMGDIISRLARGKKAGSGKPAPVISGTVLDGKTCFSVEHL